MTRYYVQEFTIPDADTSLSFTEFLFGKNITEQAMLIECLALTMARSTLREFEWLARCPAIRPHWFKAMEMYINLSGRCIYKLNAMNNLRHTTHCFVHVIKVGIPKKNHLHFTRNFLNITYFRRFLCRHANPMKIR